MRVVRSSRWNSTEERLSNCNSSGRDTNRKLCRTIRVSRHPGIRTASILASCDLLQSPPPSIAFAFLRCHRNLPAALSIPYVRKVEFLRRKIETKRESVSLAKVSCSMCCALTIIVSRGRIFSTYPEYPNIRISEYFIPENSSTIATCIEYF